MLRIPKNSELKEEDIKILLSNTELCRDRILLWYEKYKELNDEGEIFDRKKINKCLVELRPLIKRRDAFIDSVFKAFDKDDSGFLGFKDFFLAFMITSKGNLQDRLVWVYKHYDVDGSNYIDINEFTKIIETFYQLLDVQYDAHGNNPMAKAKMILKSLDVNNDKKISKEEFIRGCMDDEFLRDILAHRKSSNSKEHS